MFIACNVGHVDRAIRFVLGIVFLGLGLSGALSGVMEVVAYVLALIGIGTAAVEFCPLYAAVGIRTCRPPAKGSSR